MVRQVKLTPKEKRDEAIKMYQSGKTKAVIANYFETSWQAVNRWLKGIEQNAPKKIEDISEDEPEEKSLASKEVVMKYAAKHAIDERTAQKRINILIEASEVGFLNREQYKALTRGGSYTAKELDDKYGFWPQYNDDAPAVLLYHVSLLEPKEVMRQLARFPEIDNAINQIKCFNQVELKVSLTEYVDYILEGVCPKIPAERLEKAKRIVLGRLDDFIWKYVYALQGLDCVAMLDQPPAETEIVAKAIYEHDEIMNNFKR